VRLLRLAAAGRRTRKTRTLLTMCPSGKQKCVHARSAEDPSSYGWYNCGCLLRLLQPGLDQLGTPAPMDQREPALVHHVPDPIPVRPIREREDDLFAPLKDVDRCSIHTARDSSAMHDNAEVGSPGRDGPKKGVRDEPVDSSKPRRKGHPQDDSADGSVGGPTGTSILGPRSVRSSLAAWLCAGSVGAPSRTWLLDNRQLIRRSTPRARPTRMRGDNLDGG
jgi:hypothetical protein